MQISASRDLLVAAAFVLVSFPARLTAADADISVVARPHPKPGTRLDDPSLQARYDAMWNQYTADIVAASENLRAELKARADKAVAMKNTPLASYWQEVHETCTRWGFVSWNERQARADWQRFGGAPFPTDFTNVLTRIRTTCDSTWRALDKKYEPLVRQCQARKLDALTDALSMERKSVAAWHGDIGPEAPPSLPVSDNPPQNKKPIAPPTVGPKPKRPLKKL